MTNHTPRPRTLTTKIESGVYRIGDYVAYEVAGPANFRWKLGKPIDWEDPIGEGLINGTVTYHPTLRDAGRVVRLRRRAARFVQASKVRGAR